LIRPHLWIDAEIVKKRRMRAAHHLERRPFQIDSSSDAAGNAASSSCRGERA